MQKKIKKIHLTTLGSLDFNLPIIEIGKSRPKLLIINNLHGNELSGFYILEKFLKLLPNKIQGTITIVTSVNLLGLLHKHRMLPIDFVDLNRNYPPTYKERGINVVIKEQLIKLALDYDVVFDIHNFVNPCLSAGIAIKQNSKKNQKIMYDCFRVLKTDIIIAMNEKIKEEKRVANSFTSYMASQNKVAFGVEYSPSQQLGDKQIAKYANGLKDMISVIGLSKQKIDFKNCSSPPVFQRQQIISRKTGLFIPVKKLLDKVKAKDVLGYIIDIKSFTREPVISSYSGTLIEIAEQRFYVFGEKLATIGKKIKR